MGRLLLQRLADNRHEEEARVLRGLLSEARNSGRATAGVFLRLGRRSANRKPGRAALSDENADVLAESRGAVMFYRKNLPGWERAMRAFGGVVMIAYGLVGMPGTTAGYFIAGMGAVAIVTGFFGFCPMCAMVGRRLPSQ